LRQSATGSFPGCSGTPVNRASLTSLEKTPGLIFTLNVSHQELASEIGTVRELVTRNLARLQAQGLIEINGRKIAIADPQAPEAELSAML
jgi:CRP-like cAMP-binding protein